MGKNKDLDYKIMVWMYKIQDYLSKPKNKLVDFDIKQGDTVVDYGCGPGRHVLMASEAVGENGKVIAADINPIAIKNVIKRINKNKLKNVIPIICEDGNISENIADVVYALDMFHQIEDPTAFFEAIHKIIKPSGFFYLEDGHQPRTSTILKIKQSELWEIEEEKEKYIKIKPMNK